MSNVIMNSQTSVSGMTISSISKLNEVCSPEVVIHGIPWKIKACKNKGKNSLAINVQCMKRDKTSTWAVPASATIKLISYSDEENALEYHIGPHVFNTTSPAYGYSSFIEWDELMKHENKYVLDDTIELKVEITAEDPNYVNRSILKFESIDKSCDCGSYATFRLTVANVKHLMVVRSPQFIVRGLPWDLSVYKDQTSELGIALFPDKSAQNTSCNIKMSVKLLSSKNDAIKESNSGKVQWPINIRISDLISWNELLKPENGYVNNDSITLEVKIKADKLVGGAPHLDANIVAKRSPFECSICLEEIDKQDVSTTPCYHLFCTACITAAVRKSPACPLCKEPVQLNDLHRMYLSAAK